MLTIYETQPYKTHKEFVKQARLYEAIQALRKRLDKRQVKKVPDA